MSLIDSLNPPQQHAVQTTTGPVLVLAGPGSGKTRVLTHRIAYLIEEMGVPPWHIMAVTFTNKAADVMRERTAALLQDPGGLQGLTLGTFHRICARWLRIQAEGIGLNPRYVIFDSDDQVQVIKQALRELNLDEKRFRPRAVQAAISQAKNELITPAHYPIKSYQEEVVARLYERYQQLLAQSSALDFDDLLMQTVFMLRDHVDIRRNYQTRFEYILVDEFQDTNTAQYELVRLLAGGHGNVFVVGDEDQCVIAGTRVATPEGPVPVETLVPGDAIISASGQHDTVTATIDAVPHHRYSGQVVVMQTSSGHHLRTTPEHCMFARFVQGQSQPGDLHREPERDGQRGAISSRPDARGLGALSSPPLGESIASENDDVYTGAVLGEGKHPMTFPGNLSLSGTLASPLGADAQVDVQGISGNDLPGPFADGIKVENAAANQPCFSGATNHRSRPGVEMRFTMFGQTGLAKPQQRLPSHQEPQLSHELVVWGHRSLGDAAETIIPTGSTEGQQWRAHLILSDYDDLLETCDFLSELAPVAHMQQQARILDHCYDFLPAGCMRPGARVPILTSHGDLQEDVVTTIRTEHYEGLVYDISVPRYRNFVAEGFVVHNSIYRFRGADFRNVARFRQDFPDAEVILLEQNYRSTQNILDGANHLISHNRHRTAKALFTDRGQGPKITVHQAYDEHDEGNYILDEIERLQARGEAQPGDCAIMYRTNAQSRAVEEAFIRRGLPYRLVGATRFYSRREIKDVIAYMRLVHNPDDDVSLRRIVNVPPRRIGATTLNRLGSWTAAADVSLYEGLRRLGGTVGSAPGESAARPPITGRSRTALMEFYDLVQGWIEVRNECSPAQLLDRILAESGYGEWLRDGSDEGEERWNNVLELRTVSSTYDDLDTTSALDTFLEEVALVSDVDDFEVQTEVPTLLTLHAAKGLEFGAVFIVGLEEGLLPHSRSFEDPDAMEEERRLAYVGVTRAENRLYLLHSFRRATWGRSDISEPSRFLRDLPKRLTSAGAIISDAYQRATTWESPGSRLEAGPPARSSSGNRRRPIGPERSHAFGSTLQFGPGQRVQHPVFGEGVVVSSQLTKDDEEVTVAFPNKGVKRLLASYANLTLMSG